MSVVKINAVTVPQQHAGAFAERFQARAGEVGKAEGFEEFRLLRPSDDREVWLVYTRWRDEAAFEKWMSSASFGRAHSGQSAGPPMGTHSELWSYQEVQQEAAV